MPFLRRRGILASESELRRHTMLPDRPDLPPKIPPLKTNRSNFDLPALSSSPHIASNGPATTATTNGPTPAVPAPPVTPPHDSPSSVHGPAMPPPPPAADPIERPDSPPIQEETPKHRRFPMLRFRNASDSQLSARAKKQAQAEEPVPPVPRPPEIITTAPTLDFAGTVPRKQSRIFTRRLRRSGEEARPEEVALPVKEFSKKNRRRTFMFQGSSSSEKQSVSIDEPGRPKSSNASSSRRHDNGTALPLPTSRYSESSRSEGSSGDPRLHGNGPGTARTSHTSTPLFRIPRRKPKQPEPLFPIAHLQRNRSHGENVSSNPSLTPSTPIRASISSAASGFGPQQQTPTVPGTGRGIGLTTPPGPSPARALFQKANASPATALFRPNSRNSGASSPTRPHARLRGRSSTMSSLGRESLDDRLAPPNSRTSTSTGRKSFGDLLGISRLRNNPESTRQGCGTPATPGSNTSKDNSLHIQRESITLPDRRPDENPARYLERLEEVISHSVIAAALSKNSDTFSLAVLRSYMRKFSFFGDPMDMAIRKLLMEAELPKETQHIDRCLQSFANRYHECNPGIYSNPDQAYFIAFSLLILHTDAFNKNNKHKMQKADYIKNTRDEGIFDEILEVFYDNITYTPFIRVEDDLDVHGERGSQKSKKKSMFPNNSTNSNNITENTIKKAAKEPIDPYTLIIDHRLDILRPNLKDVMHLDDHFSYIGTAKNLNLRELQKTFFRTGVLQIVSARSRPDAFMSEKTAINPEEAQPGVVDIKITKVGLLWRKDVKKKKGRSPWQEWGAILTGAQLYFFRNTTWVKNLMHQYEAHIKQGHDGVPIIFKPPLENFKPDALMSTDGAVALLDSTYKKHKHAFVYVRHGGLEEVLLADDEYEMNDWLAKLNYAAAFRTSGVRMRGVIGGQYDGQGRRALRRLDTEAVQTPSGEVTIARSKIDHKMAQEISAARREVMFRKVAEANEKLEQEEKKLEKQLRNARHLQILAPIQPKTRDQMLMSAARMAAQLKWTQVEIWKTKCHRDVLLLDLEDERQVLGLPEGASLAEPSTPEKPALGRETSKASAGTAVQSLRSPATPSIHRSPTAAENGNSVPESPSTDAFQTPPTSARAPSFHKHQPSWETPVSGFSHKAVRKASVSSAVSSHRTIPVTPPRTAATSSSAPSAPEGSNGEHHSNDVDAGERDLLAQTGLLGPEITRSPEAIDQTTSADGEDASEWRERMSHINSADKADRNKIRRSLQRTLREGAGHLSHGRSRKGKDSTSSAVADENAREPETLTRGSGPFVVHGKKASVINFGSELQSVSPDLRNRKVSQQVEAAPNGGDASNAGGNDFRMFLISGPQHTERRESAASASTATARSFRELHRKYSTAQGKAASVGGTLTVPSDEDSDAAVSFSEGRRSPLPPIGAEEAVDEAEKEVDGSVDGDQVPGLMDPESTTESVPVLQKEGETIFFTPEPPRPLSSNSAKGKGKDTGSRKDEDRLPSPVFQAVGV